MTYDVLPSDKSVVVVFPSPVYPPPVIGWFSSVDGYRYVPSMCHPVLPHDSHWCHELLHNGLNVMQRRVFRTLPVLWNRPAPQWLTNCARAGPAASRVQELCESRGGRPGLSVLTNLMVSVDVKQHWTVLTHWSQCVPNMSADIREH